jgi:hypothetical protein
MHRHKQPVIWRYICIENALIFDLSGRFQRVAKQLFGLLFQTLANKLLALFLGLK